MISPSPERRVTAEGGRVGFFRCARRLAPTRLAFPPQVGRYTAPVGLKCAGAHRKLNRNPSMARHVYEYGGGSDQARADRHHSPRRRICGPWLRSSYAGKRGDLHARRGAIANLTCPGEEAARGAKYATASAMAVTPACSRRYLRHSAPIAVIEFVDLTPLRGPAASRKKRWRIDSPA